jgi:hypothetical protein
MMSFEEAEAIVSDASGHSDADVALASSLLGLLQSPVAESLIEALTRLEKTSASTAEQAIYSELLVAVGEAKVKISQIARKVENDRGHIAHFIAEKFQQL